MLNLKKITRNKYNHTRLLYLFLISLSLLIMVGIITSQLKSAVSFFYSPYELLNNVNLYNKLIRVGGLVSDIKAPPSLPTICKKNHPCHLVIISDDKTSINVILPIALPPLLRIGQGAVIKGHFSAHEKKFIGSEILIKHDETYMSKERYRKKGQEIKS